MPKVKKQKQKQKQKQRQTVIVNVNQRATARRRAPSRRGGGSRGGGGGGGVVSVPYPVYTNAPSDYAPIIHNLPTQFQNQPALSLPIQALENIPTATAVSFPPPTQLQTVREDVRPLVSAMKTQSLLEELKEAQLKRDANRLGSITLGSNITPKRGLTPFQEELKQTIARRASTPQQFTGEPSSSSSFVRPISRHSTPSPMTMEENPMLVSQEEKKRLKKIYDANKYQEKKAQKKMGPG